MAFEDLLKNKQTNTKSNTNLVNLSSSLANKHKDNLAKKEVQLQSIMINQGEYDYLALQIKFGKKDLMPMLLQKKYQIIEQEILYNNNLGLTNLEDAGVVNKRSDDLINYRLELESIKKELINPSQYSQSLLESIEKGIDLEGTLVDSIDKYLELIAEKLKFGGIIDQNRTSRLCGFGSQAAKSGDLLVAIKSYSTAGMINRMQDDFKKILKKAKKEKNPQHKEAEVLINNLTSKLKKK